MIGGLKLKAVVLVGSVLLLALVSNTAVVTFVAYGRYRESLTGRARALADNLAEDVNKVLALGLGLRDIDGLETKLSETVDNDSSLAFVEIIDAEGRTLFRSVRKSSTVSTTGPDDSAGELTQSAKLSNAEKIAVGRVSVAIERAGLEAELYRLLRSAVVVGVGSFAIFLVLVYFVTIRFVIKPITDMEAVTRKIAAGDLTQKIGFQGNDELGALGLAINEMTRQLRVVLRHVREIAESVNRVADTASESCASMVGVARSQREAVEGTATAISEMSTAVARIAGSSDSLRHSSDEASSAVTSMTQSVSSIAEGANVFHEAAENAASNITELMTAVAQIAGSSESLSRSAKRTVEAVNVVNATVEDIRVRADESVSLAGEVSAQASERGRTAAAAAGRGMEEIRASVGALAEGINRLGERSEEIGTILTVVSEVAQQTSLLSLNAAILAAQAGEEGKAFAVVAAEIKSLAERTAVSTKRIAEIIAWVQSETRSSVEMAGRGFAVATKGVALVRDVDDALGSIAQSAQAAAEMAKAIQAATAESARVTRQITGAVEDITQQISHISGATQEQSRGGHSIVEAADRIRGMAADLKQTTEAQFRQSGRISDVSGEVAGQANQISASIGQQQERSRAVANAMESIRTGTGELTVAATRLNGDILELRGKATNLLEVVERFTVRNADSSIRLAVEHEQARLPKVAVDA